MPDCSQASMTSFRSGIWLLLSLNSFSAMSHTAPQAPDTLGCWGFGWVRVFPISEDGASGRRSMGRG